MPIHMKIKEIFSIFINIFQTKHIVHLFCIYLCKHILCAWASKTIKTIKHLAELKERGVDKKE